MSTSMARDVAAYAKLLWERGHVANHDGNISARLPDGVRFMATPTATSKRLVEPHDILTVDAAGKILAGRRRLFSEWHLHRACYAARPDARVVLHAHPVHATALGCAGAAIGVPPLPEAVVSLGAVPTLGLAAPKSAAQDEALVAALTKGDADAVLLAGNGVITVGTDLEQAWLRLELVEHCARIVCAAAQLGGVQPLPAAMVAALLEARTKAGLGALGRRAGA